MVWNWLRNFGYIRKEIKTYVCEVHKSDHTFYLAKRINSETLEVEGIDYPLYIGIEPILMDTLNHPDPRLRRLKAIKVFFHQFGQPFVREPPYSGKFLSEEKKASTLIERGFYQIILSDTTYTALTKEEKELEIMPKWDFYLNEKNISSMEKEQIISHPQTKEKILLCKCSDMDFVRDDFASSTLSNMYTEFEKASPVGSFVASLFNFYTLTVVSILGFYFMYFDMLTPIMAFIAFLIEVLKG